MSVFETDPEKARMSGQYKQPTVFEIEMEFDQQVRVPDGCGDDKFSHWVRERRIVHILAQTQEMAEATWRFDNIYPNCKNVMLSCKPICTINLFCNLSRGRSF